jgi:hypothetical protein
MYFVCNSLFVFIIDCHLGEEPGLSMKGARPGLGSITLGTLFVTFSFVRVGGSGSDRRGSCTITEVSTGKVEFPDCG